MSHLKIHILWCFLFLGGLTIYAQETKEEIEEKALAHFEKEEFIEATPLYLRLLSLAPRDPNYNYRYGTCLLFNSKRKDVAFKYLNFAVTSGEVDMEAYYYLGRAYHLTYQFRKAIENYEKYKQLAGARASKKLDVNRQIEMCRSGQSLLANLSETLVLRKQEIPLDEFFRIYDLNDIGGELIVTAEFQTKLDKKNNHVPLIHFPSNSDRIFYSSYGESENSGKDIFMRTRLPDKSWSLAQKVFGDINTPYDEDFPYMHPDGRYLYFCSKGHNSMGGYDVFRSRYDPETNTYLKPENMDFAISSPDDDILYIVDSLDRYAYFASQRESEAGKINVYHVRVERIPMQIAIIKGTFASTIDPGNKELSIAVYSDATGKLMGNYATTTKGDYLINLPKGGKYQFVLQVGGKDTEYKQIIDVPYLKEFRPLKQKITETFQDGNEVVLIQNLFDELFDDPIAILAEVIQKQSQMKVNKDEYDLDSLDRLGEQRKILATLGLEGYSKLEIRQMAQSKVNDLTERLEKSEERLAQSLASIVDANKRMEILIKRADSLTLLATNTDDLQKKANYTRSAQQALENAKKQADNIESAKIIAEFMEKDRDETYKRLEKAKKFNDELVAIKADDENGFLATLNKNKLYIEEELKTRTTIDAQFELMSEISEQIKRSEEARKKQKELEEQRASLETEIQQLKDELPNAKRKDAERIQQEIDSKENLLSDIANEQNYLNKEVEKYNQAINQQDVLANLKNQETNPDYTSIENVMNRVSEDLSTIDSRIEDNQESMALYEANESQSNIVNEVIEPIQKSTEQLIEKTERSDLAYKNNEISTNEYLTEKENTLKELKKNLQSLESASDEFKSGQNYKSILAQLNEEVSQLEKDIAEAQTILSLEKELQVALENSLNQPENSNKSIKELEKELISNLNEEKSTISSDATLDSASKSSKIAAIDLLIEKLSVADGSYFEKDESIATNNSETTFNSEEKAAVLSAVDRSYTADISDLEKQLSNEEISTQEVLDRKQEYVNKLEAALEDILAEIEKKGETPERLKEKAILEQELATVQSEIAELNQLIAAQEEGLATNNNKTTFTEEEKVAILNKVDRSYTADVNDLEKQLSNEEISTQEVLDRKEEYVNKLEAALKDILAEIEKKGETPERLKEKAILDQELATVQSEIAELNQLIAAQEEGLATNNSKTTFTEEEKVAVLNKVDRSYSIDIGELEEQLRNEEISTQEVLDRKEEYVNKLEAALEEILAEIEKKGETPERLKEKAILEQELATLQSEIAELNQLIAAQEEGLATNNSKSTFTEQEKAVVLNKVDRSYSIDIGDLDEQLRNGDISAQEVLNRKEEYANKLEAALEDILAEIEKKGETSERLKEKAILDQELATVQSEIAELNQLIAAQEEGLATNNSKTTFTEEEKVAVLNKVDRSYSIDIGDLDEQLRNGDISAQEVLNRKEEYANKLEAARENILAEIEKKGETPDRLKEKAILEQELATLQSEIAELNQLIANQEGGLATNNSKTTFTAEEKAAVVNKVDRSYSIDIGDLDEQLRNGDISAQEVLDRKEEYVNKLEAALEDILAEIEKKGETSERLKEKAILEQELATVQSEIAELNQLIAAQEEGLATNNIKAVFTEEEKVAVLSKVDRSYSIEIGDLDEQLRNGDISAQEVLDRKEEYANKLEAAREDILAEIEKKGETPERLKEKAILEQELERINLEINELQTPLANGEEESIDAIVAQSELSETEKSAITSTENNLSALKNKLAALDKLTLVLQKQVSIETNESTKINLTKQIETVEKKKRQVSFEIGELEQENIAALIPENVTEATTEKQKRDIESSQEKVNTLSESKSDLQASLLNANSENEKEKIQSKIDKTDEKIAKEEADVLNTTTRVSEEVLANEFNDLNKQDKETISTLEADRLRLNAESLIQQAENEKDPVAKRNLLAAAQEKQNEALASIEKTKSDKQQQAIVAEIITSENIAIKEPEAVFKSEQKLAQEQQSIAVQLMQIKEQINEIDFLSRTASKKEVETLETRRAELVQLQKQLISKRKSNEEDLALIQQEKEATKSKGIDEESIDYQLSYKEEVEIAESDKYKALFPAINKLEQKQYEMKVKEEFIALNTEKINQVLANNPSPTQQEKEEVASLLKTIANEQSKIETLKLEIREQQEVIQTLLPSDPREREITQNLLARSVNPIDKAPILPIMATGLIIANENEKVYSSENPIPIDAEKPKGLFFRVQIGAFGKPVPNETFNDFSPVSGEQVRPGLIRYMAGYFGGRRDAEQARDRIRTMGYNDAFVVAYCDGERIPVYRAVQLMESGACVPSITSSESPILTASENGTELSSGGFEAELDEFAYNKAPGAADAVAGETKLGLYYTVQVGVYNRPVPASQLKNISPLVTMRLPNGQMRYSSGMFDDIPQARIKQQEAVSLGISDAYIVAYYKGERISVSQANKLLGEFGNSILESVTPTTRKKNNLESTVSAPTPPAEPVLKNKKVTVQYRSKETYNSYPTQVLNRYNENEGFFYYDEITRTIQSALYSEEMAPSLSLIQNELEEVRYYSVFEIADKEAVELDLALKNTDQLVHQLTIHLASSEISDDLINTFLKANLLKRITSIESGLILEFYEIGTADKINSIQTEMARLGATEINMSVLKCDLNK